MIELELTDAPAEADVHAILAGILAVNNRHLGEFDRRPLAVIARRAGRLVGGITGETSRSLLHVDLLWVAPDHRGCGLGSRLLRAAEEEARRRGCGTACLETYDFQARPFYERHGYSVFGGLDGYPNGHRNFCLVKRLEGAVDGQPDRAAILTVARLAGLHLPAAYADELVDAYAYIRALVDRLPRPQARSDEPAHVFGPARFAEGGP